MHSTNTTSPRQPAPPDKRIALCGHWRLRALLACLLLLAGIAGLALMIFGSGSLSMAGPDPARLEAELGETVTERLEAARPADQPLFLPQSVHARSGLLPIKYIPPDPDSGR